MNAPGFDLDVTFTGNSDSDVLTPLGIPDFADLSAGTTNNQDVVRFRIAIQQAAVDRLVATIKTASATLYRAELPAALRTVGQHDWRWDGFGTNGVLDTKILKDPALTIEFSATLGGQTRSKTLSLVNEHAEVDWVDVEINKTRREIAVELRVDVKNGGGNGVGEAPPADVQALPRYRSIPRGDVRRQRHVRARSHAQLSGLVHAGLQRYWSRQIAAGGTTYTVRIDPIAATRNAMDDIDVEYNTNGSWVRSSNPGGVRDIVSFFGNLVPERIVYNVGWIKFAGGWVYIMPSAADQAFLETAAHEMGHEILSAYGGSEYSYGHRGSSTVVSQERRPLGDGGVSYPASGEIDLMKYYHGPRPATYSSRIFASEQDVKSLLWLARVKFDA